jgi:hypothetical protein
MKKISSMCYTSMLQLNIDIKEKKPLPCMNQELRRAVYRKQMLYSQFTKCQGNKNWENSESKEIL